MDKLTKEELQQLMEIHRVNCVTIYAPMVKDDPQQYDKNRIYFKNGLTDVREQMSAMSDEEIEDYLKPLSRLLTDDVFWGNQSDGLAAFLADDVVKTYRLPIEFEPAIFVSSRLHIKPLLSYFENSHPFHILAISQNNLRLFTADRYGITESSLENVPTSLDEALKFDDPEREQQGHTAAARQGRGDNTDVMYHSHNPQDEQTSNLKRFAWQIRNGLADNLLTNKTPILLAGTPEIVAYLRESADFNFTEETIGGNVDHLDDKALHKKAWEIIEPLFSAEREQSIEKYNILSETDQVTTDRTQVVQAAYFGAVDTLFISASESLWGVFDEASGTVSVHAIRQDDSIDLFDAAAAKTVENGGTVLVDANGAPRLAAILRYTADALPS